jgi:hypothetical protein
LAVQEDGAAPCVEEGPHGDGAGAGQGGRGLGRHGQRRVRFSACIRVSLVCHSARPAGPSTRSGWSFRSGRLGCAGGRRCTGRRGPATRRRRWRWPRRARTCTRPSLSRCRPKPRGRQRHRQPIVLSGRRSAGRLSPITKLSAETKNTTHQLMCAPPHTGFAPVAVNRSRRSSATMPR